MSIKFVGMEDAMAKLKKHKLLVLGQITDTKKRLVRHVLTDLVTNSPQWSGNLASNWYIEYTGVRGEYTMIDGYEEPGDWVNEGSPYSMGDNPAVAQTIRRELMKIPGIRWNTKVRIVNYTPYAADVEQGIGPMDAAGRPTEIRPENKLASYGAVAMVGYVSVKYSNLRNLRKLAE